MLTIIEYGTEYRIIKNKSNVLEILKNNETVRKQWSNEWYNRC